MSGYFEATVLATGQAEKKTEKSHSIEHMCGLNYYYLLFNCDFD